MRNTFITGYQRRMRRNTFIDTTENLHFINSNENSTQNQAFATFVLQDITTAIEQVAETYSQPFMMYFKGFKYHEIAETLDLPIGTVKNRIHLARHELRDKLHVYKYYQV